MHEAQPVPGHRHGLQQQHEPTFCVVGCGSETLRPAAAQAQGRCTDRGGNHCNRASFRDLLIWRTYFIPLRSVWALSCDTPLTGHWLLCDAWVMSRLEALYNVPMQTIIFTLGVKKQLLRPPMVLLECPTACQAPPSSLAVAQKRTSPAA